MDAAKVTTMNSPGSKAQAGPACPKETVCSSETEDEKIQNSRSPWTRSGRRVPSKHSGIHENQDRSPLQQSLTNFVGTGGWTGVRTLVVNLPVDIECSPSSQAVQLSGIEDDIKCIPSSQTDQPVTRGDSIRRCRTPSGAGSPFPLVGNIINDQLLNDHDKVTPICTRSVDSLHVDRTRFQVDPLHVDRKSEKQVENAKSKRLWKLLHQERAALRRSQNVEPEITAQNIRLEHEPETVSNLVYKRKRRSRKLSEESTRKNQDEILSQNKMIEEKPQRSFCEQESCLTSISGQANVHEQLSTISGFYRDESATPVHLHTALCKAKSAVTRFQKLLCDPEIQSGINSVLPHPGCSFPRADHSDYWVKSIVYRLYFIGFENESFHTSGGVSRFLDPNIRQTKYYEYYLSEREKNNADDIKDPQFEEFCKKKGSHDFFRRFSVGNEGFGGPQLASSFRAAARSVWLLHKLAFSFEPPASIFRVGRGADVDPNYMEAVVDLDDSELYIPKSFDPHSQGKSCAMQCRADDVLSDNLPCGLSYFENPYRVTSVIECIRHGIPDSRVLLDGDIINIDVIVYLNIGKLLESWLQLKVDDFCFSRTFQASAAGGAEFGQ